MQIEIKMQLNSKEKKKSQEQIIQIYNRFPVDMDYGSDCKLTYYIISLIQDNTFTYLIDKRKRRQHITEDVLH